MLIPSVRRSALGPEEDELRRQLGALEEGAGMTRMAARMNELWAAVGSVQAMGEKARREGAGSSVEWAVVDEEGLGNIAQVRVMVDLGSFRSDEIYRFCVTSKTDLHMLPRFCRTICER
jgi:nuclear pore complex protein Nup54